LTRRRREIEVTEVSERRIEVQFLPSIVSPEQLRDHVVVVIDVLRATTTIITALQNGAAQIIPCGTIDEAREWVVRFQPRGLLGGERNGSKIPGFDLGNGPPEYSAEVVRDQTIVLATTNGTPAMAVCREAKCVWIGGFINAQAIVKRTRAESLVTFLCAGTDGRITGEDVLFAGCAIERLQRVGANAKLNDQATLALWSWNEACKKIALGTPLADLLAEMHGGRNLVRKGMRGDIDFCAVIDRFDCVPELDLGEWTISIP
jgi:2-phosphosulfolactate phosphatase